MLEKTLESPLDCKEIKPVSPKEKSVLNIHWKDWCWSWNSNTLATWCEELTHLKRPWCWERWKAGGEGDDRGWDGLMASLTQWTWVWVNSGSWWWIGRPDVLQSMGSQRVTQDWMTELTENSHDSKFTLLPTSQCTVQWRWIQSQGGATIPTVWIQNIFITHKRDTVPISSHFLFLPPPPPATTNLLFFF